MPTLPLASPAWCAAWIGALQGAAVALVVLVQLVLGVFALHRWRLVWRHARTAGERRTRPPVLREWPHVTVQLPVFNERFVIERLIGAAARLDYPRGRLEIQVLDDSSDETRVLAAAAVAHHAARGVAIRHLHRSRRDGCKAGALAAGLAAAGGELIAVFDADFVPPRDFLLRLVPRFSDSGVGMVQARWGHLNRDASWLTAAQAVLLDSHFVLEHGGRMRAGQFFNFNGTAGIWRRACIESAGGWSDATLTEDLDLSYRAQLAGWRFVYDGTVEAPAELPADIEAFQSQQRRWAKGSIQTARRILPRLLASRLPFSLKFEALLHLAGNSVYPLVLLPGLLLPAVITGHGRFAPLVSWSVSAALVLLGIVPAALFLAVGQRALGRPFRAIARDLFAALLLSAGLAINNTRAVLEGLGGRVGAWERTPKTGSASCAASARAYVVSRGPAGRTELACALYLLGAAVLAFMARQPAALPFVLLLACGCAAVGGAALRASAARLRSG